MYDKQDAHPRPHCLLEDKKMMKPLKRTLPALLAAIAAAAALAPAAET